jgi:hypothetical protein
MEVHAMNLKKLGSLSPILVALLVAIPIGWVSDTYAQGGLPGSPAAPGAGGMQAPGAGGMQGAPKAEQEVEGKIKSVSGRTVTLEDGTELTIPSNAQVKPGLLVEGAIVRASYEEQGGQKIVTSMEVEQPGKSPRY